MNTNTEKVEKKLYEMIGDVWFPDLEKSKIKEIQDFIFRSRFFARRIGLIMACFT